jgi:hypothetical protein
MVGMASETMSLMVEGVVAWASWEIRGFEMAER